MAAGAIDLPEGFQLDSPAPAMTAVPGLPEGFQLDQPSVGAGLAKAGGIGLAEGLIGMAGLPGDAMKLGQFLVDKGAGALGVRPETIAGAQGVRNQALDKVGRLPGASNIQSAIESQTGKFYEPQTVPEQYVRTIGQFAPAAVGGPGSLARRAVTQAVIPAIASETAGQATQGTAAEPYARIAAAIAGGAAPGLLARAVSSGSGTTIQQVKQAASEGYKALDTMAPEVVFKPNVMDTLANTITKSLDRSKLNDRIAGETRAVVEDLKTPINGTAHTLEDLRTTKSILGDMAGQLENGKPTQNARAAAQAKGLLDKYIESSPQGHVASGDFPAASKILKTADADYAAGMTAERVSDKLRNADLRAASTYSGGNLNNATRQNLRTLLTSRKQGRGLTADELQTIEDTVRGSTAGNFLRAGGKLLGGGGGLGMLASGATGHMLAGPLGLAAPAIGFGAKKIGDAITRRNADQIVQQILSRSPTGMANTAAIPSSPQGLNFLRTLLLSTPSTLPLRTQFAPAQQ